MGIYCMEVLPEMPNYVEYVQIKTAKTLNFSELKIRIVFVSPGPPELRDPEYGKNNGFIPTELEYGS